MCKSNFIVLLMLTFILSTKTRSQAIVGKVFITFSDQINVYGLDDHGNLDSNSSYAVRKNTKFSIVGFDADNNVLITFWRYYYDPAQKKKVYINVDTFTKTALHSYPKDKAFISRWANFKKFALKPTVLNSSCKEYYGVSKEFTWGVMTLPIKARFGNHKDKYFDFEERLNLGFVFGMKKQLKGYVVQSLNYLAGFGVTSVRTDSISLKDVSFYDGKTSLALSFHIGALYQIENFQVGLFLGTDVVPTKVGRVWYHQGRPWVGLAIGVSLFSKNANGSDNSNNTNDSSKDEK